jgi:hypothetical protein
MPDWAVALVGLVGAAILLVGIVAGFMALDRRTENEIAQAWRRRQREIDLEMERKGEMRELLFELRGDDDEEAQTIRRSLEQELRG